MLSIVNACATENEINCKNLPVMHFVDDSEEHFSRNNFWFHSIVSWVFADENDERRPLPLPSYTEALFLVRL